MLVKIRPFRNTDLSQVHQLYTYTQKLHVNANPDLFIQPVSENQFKKYLLESDRNQKEVLVAEYESSVVGYLVWFEHVLQENVYLQESAFLIIDQIAVDPQFQRRGVAANMIDEVIDKARSAKASRILADVWSWNESSRDLFASKGFSQFQAIYMYDLSP